MLGGNPKMLWQVRKELEKRGLRGPEADKGAKGGLFMNHYDLLAIRNVFHISHYLTKQKKYILFNNGLHCNLTSFNIVPSGSYITGHVWRNYELIIDDIPCILNKWIIRQMTRQYFLDLFD